MRKRSGKITAMLVALVTAVSCLTVSTVSADGFADVTAGDWFYDAVTYVCAKGYFGGVSDTEFQPQAKVSRGMLVTILGKIQGIDTTQYTGSQYSDVAETDWYAPYIAWAVGQGIATPYEDGLFHPDTYVNKEQICVQTERYLKAYNRYLAPNEKAISAYSDESVVSSWAREGVDMLRAAGVITGDTGGYFRPRSSATRAETATIVMRLCRVLEGETLAIPEIVDETAQIMQSMSLTEKVYQMFVVTPEKLTGVETVTRAGETTKDALAQFPVGGIVYKAQNLISAAQTKEMIESTKSYCRFTPFIATDEEGGAVARVAAKLGTRKFSPMYYYRNDGADKAYEIGCELSADIKQFGFNQDYAPVADVWTNTRNTAIATRAFSNDPNVVATMASAEVRGMRDSMMISTLKHFPGHGDTNEDSHTEKAYSYKYLDEMRQCEFIPFEQGIKAGADFVMCAHIITPNVDADNPATMSSKFVTDLLRGELEFGGVIITDALDMHAVSSYYSSGDAAKNCINAGCDMLLCPDTLSEAASSVIAAVNNGEISEERINESVRRILGKKLEYGLIG